MWGAPYGYSAEPEDEEVDNDRQGFRRGPAEALACSCQLAAAVPPLPTPNAVLVASAEHKLAGLFSLLQMQA